MRMRDALAGLLGSLGWEAESDNPVDLVSQLSDIVEVSNGVVSVKEPPPPCVCKVGKTGYQSVSDAISAGGTIRLVSDITEHMSVPEGASVTLDLNGHSVTTEGTAIANSGRLTVRNGVIESTKSFAVISNSGAVTNVERCTVRSVEGAVITGKAKGTTVKIGSCDLSATDNAVVAGNGSKGFGGNRITVTASKLKGGITSSGYVACGVYCPNDDEFFLSGCQVDVTGGCGILSRAGRVTVSDTDITVTGTVTGKVGDSRVVVPCACLVFDEEADYPSLSDEDRIRAHGCRLSSEVEKVAVIGDGRRVGVS